MSAPEIVYVVMYNYAENHYSMVKTMKQKESAYQYICSQEEERVCQLKTVFDPNQLKKINQEVKEGLVICELKKNTKYYQFSLCDYDNLSRFILVECTVN